MAGSGNQAVVDASVIIGWLLPDELTNEQAQVWLKEYQEKKLHLAAPTILFYEVINALKSAVRRKRATFDQVKRIAEKFLKLEIKFFPMEQWTKTLLTTADKYNLSVYDAAYVVLTKKLKINLLSFDKRLQKL